MGLIGVWQWHYAKHVYGNNSPQAGPIAPRSRSEVKVDVCVIGAGITGLSAAIHLLEQGKSVAVLEAHRTGHGGSGRNVGLVNAGMWIPPDEIEAGFGEAVGIQLNRMLGAAPSLVFSLIDKYKIDCQLRREGTLHMAHNARGEADLRSREEQWKRRGAPVELLTGQACEQATGTKDRRRPAGPARWHLEPNGLHQWPGECRRGAWRATVRSFASHSA